MFLTKVKLVGAALIVMTVASFGVGGWLHQAQAGKPEVSSDKPAANAKRQPAQAAAGAEKDPDELLKRIVQEIHARLDRPISLERPIEKGTPLRDALDFLGDRYELTILSRDDELRALLPGRERRKLLVTLPKMSGVTLDSVLRRVLSQVGATYLIQEHGLEVVPIDWAWPERWTAIDRRYVPTVHARFDKRPLDLALRRIASLTGINVLLDPRVDPSVQKTPITAVLDQVPMDTAVRLLADMASLCVVAVDNVLYVTSPANAEVWRAERQRRIAANDQAAKSKPTSPVPDRPYTPAAATSLKLGQKPK